MMWRFCWCLIFLCFFPACGKVQYAPVQNAWHQPAAADSTYIVQTGDTIYSIAWAFDLSYQAIAQRNDLTPPYHLAPGSTLRLPASELDDQSSPAVAPVAQAPVTPSRQPKKPVVASEARWQWPINGTVLRGFGVGDPPNRGIDIAGKVGEVVHASRAGEVVYSGDKLRGYGKLIIIRDPDDFLTAYAYNETLLVKVGERVSSGQMIARLGKYDKGQARLHFEIRKDGRPVNPLSLLRPR